MKIVCTGRKVDLKDSFVERVEARLSKLDRFFRSEAEAYVTVSVEKKFQKVEITVRDASLVVRAERTAPQMEEAFEAAADVLTNNLVKNRKRLANRLQKPMEEYVGFEDIDEEYPAEDEFRLIREKHFSVKPTTPEEAILQMNMLGHNFYLFLEADSNEINVIYRRNDGSYGLLVPER